MYARPGGGVATGRRAVHAGGRARRLHAPAEPFIKREVGLDARSAEVARAVETLCSRLAGFSAAFAIEQIAFDTWPCLPPETYVGKDVLELGCGLGAASATFVARGARSVWGVDPALTVEQVEALQALPGAKFTPAPFFAELVGERRFDLAYSRVVTEHLSELPRVLDAVYAVLRPGGRFVGLHDSYYGPMGAHDQGMFGPSESDPEEIVVKAVACWSAPGKCETSSDFRAAYAREYDWRSREWTLTPDDCTLCPYYRRAQLWSHLLHARDYSTLFAGDFFRAGARGGLNKVTPFQLRQFLVEAGFAVETWRPEKVTNPPPPELLEHFTRADLQTGPILFAARKG